MTLLPVFTLTSQGKVTIMHIDPPGLPISAQPATIRNLPRNLQALFKAVEDQNPQHVVCRIIGIPDTHPHHIEEFLVPKEEKVTTIGLTF